MRAGLPQLPHSPVATLATVATVATVTTLATVATLAKVATLAAQALSSDMVLFNLTLVVNAQPLFSLKWCLACIFLKRYISRAL